MILLDTHIWVWWVTESNRLAKELLQSIEAAVDDGLGVSIISCWEVAKLVENNRLTLKLLVDEWLEQALGYPGIQLLELTPRIVVESTQLPGQFHRDPADQMIVATARAYNIAIATVDAKILNYPHVIKVHPPVIDAE
ncbi:MAG: type II toxin-antitoxin system VapC family toxin [Anaerolineae bacterium]|nr:type II toxin-antitoxin system VapC family toxin [Anaerolineae bacterium]